MLRIRNKFQRVAKKVILTLGHSDYENGERNRAEQKKGGNTTQKEETSKTISF
jgi:hypothetical protein